jgi:hypothetical protein
MRGGGPSGRSFSGSGPGMRSPSSRGSHSGFSGRSNSQRSWGAPWSHSRSFQRGGSSASSSEGRHFGTGSAARNSEAGAERASHTIADGQWHSFSQPGEDTARARQHGTLDQQRRMGRLMPLPMASGTP